MIDRPREHGASARPTCVPTSTSQVYLLTKYTLKPKTEPEE